MSKSDGLKLGNIIQLVTMLLALGAVAVATTSALAVHETRLENLEKRVDDNDGETKEVTGLIFATHADVRVLRAQMEMLLNDRGLTADVEINYLERTE